jgi:hypothetical protein
VITRKISISNSTKVSDIAGGTDRTTGYLRISVDGCRYYCHIIAWAVHYGIWPNSQIDHRDGNRKNNSITNLRLATQTQQNANAGLRKSSSSGKKGVWWCSYTNKWRAGIRKDGCNIYLGRFFDKELAHSAYCKAASDMFDEFARFE